MASDTSVKAFRPQTITQDQQIEIGMSRVDKILARSRKNSSEYFNSRKELLNMTATSGQLALKRHAWVCLILQLQED